MTRRQVVVAAAVAVAVLVVGMVAGAVSTHHKEPAPTVTVTVQATPRTPTGQPTASATATTAASTLTTGPATTAPAKTANAAPRSSQQRRSGAASASTLARQYTRDLGSLANRSGIALVPVGGGSAVVMGGQTSGAAWSTIKVPIAVAARQQPGWSSRARAAITVSDNDAAASLWASLGSGSAAAARVEAVLAAAGDSGTRVQPRVVRAGFSPFGQTQWALPAQAQAMAGLACQTSAAGTLDLMRQVVSGQRWGLGRWKQAPIKGGWGPSESGGGYVVRQMGVIPVAGGQVAVAMLVRAPAGFDAGVADLNRMAAWLADHAGQLPSGRC